MNLPIVDGLPLRIHFLHQKSHRMMARWINSHACNAEAAPPPDVSQIWIQTTPYDKHFWKKKTQESQGYSQSGTSQSRYLPNKYTRAAPMLAVVLPLFYIRFCSSFVMCPSRLDHEAGVTVRNVVQTFCWWNEAQKAALRPSNQIPLGSFSKWFKVPSGPPTEVFRESPVLTCTEVDRLTLKSDQRCKDHHLWLLPAHKASHQQV